MFMNLALLLGRVFGDKAFGRTLMMKLMERSKKSGANIFDLTLHAENEPSLKLYESVGIEVEAVL